MEYLKEARKRRFNEIETILVYLLFLVEGYEILNIPRFIFNFYFFCIIIMFIFQILAFSFFVFGKIKTKDFAKNNSIFKGKRRESLVAVFFNLFFYFLLYKSNIDRNYFYILVGFFIIKIILSDISFIIMFFRDKISYYEYFLNSAFYLNRYSEEEKQFNTLKDDLSLLVSKNWKEYKKELKFLSKYFYYKVLES